MDVYRGVARGVHRCLVIALAMAVVLAGPVAARADPVPGAVTVAFTDLCGYVQAQVTNADPMSAVQVHSYRNDQPLSYANGFVMPNSSTTLYQAANVLDRVRFEWQVAGGATEFAEHEHVTPAGCAEPNLAVSLIDDCGLYFTITIRNTGAAPADVFVTSPTQFFTPVTVPVGVVEVTVPGAPGSSAWVGRLPPGGTDPFGGLAEVGVVTRGAACGVSVNIPDAIFMPACEQVTFVFFGPGGKGDGFPIYRNGQATAGVVGLDISEWSEPVLPGDVITIGDPPLASYTHVPPDGCPAVAAAPGPAPPVGGSVTPSIRLLPVGGPPQVRPPTVIPARIQPTTTPAAAASPPVASPRVTAGPLPVGSPTPSNTVVAPPPGWTPRQIAAGVTLAAGSLAGFTFLFLFLRRRREQVWALAIARVSFRPDVRDIGSTGSLSVRCVPHGDAGTVTLREVVSP